ncbi:MAG: hypothetical protein WBH47_08485 [Streptosporangiaceae bacterium]
MAVSEEPTHMHGRARHAQPTPIRQNLVAVLLGISWFGGIIATVADAQPGRHIDAI